MDQQLPASVRAGWYRSLMSMPEGEVALGNYSKTNVIESILRGADSH